MRFIRMSGGCFLLALASFAAFAANPYVNIEERLTPEQRHATGLDTLSAEQLQLLNRLLREDAAQMPKTDGAGQDRPREDRPREGRARDDTFVVGLDAAPIRTRLKGALSGWEPGTVFELDNGQVWKVLKGSMKLPRTLQSPEVVLVPGIAGRWFLQVDEDTPKARVYRVD